MMGGQNLGLFSRFWIISNQPTLISKNLKMSQAVLPLIIKFLVLKASVGIIAAYSRLFCGSLQPHPFDATRHA